MKKVISWVTVMVTLLFVVTACATPTPEVVEKEVIVEKEVPVTVEVEKEVIVEKEVPVTVEVEKAPEESEEMVLRIGIGTFTMDWSPLRGGGDHWGGGRLGLMWAYPMYIDAEGELRPYVFEEWSSNDDMTVWTFKIDPDAVFSDGSPITAEDLKGTWDLSAHPLTKSQRADLFFGGVVGFDEVISGEAQEMTGLVAKDARTIEVTLKTPDPIYHQRLASVLVPAVKISQARGADGEQVPEWWHPKNGVVTSGPYVPESMNLDTGDFVLVRNPNFWVSRPIIDKVTYRTVEDSEVLNTMLLNDELDGGAECTPELFPKVDSGYCDGPPNLRGFHFWLSVKVEPTNDINVRKALIMAIDRDELHRVCFPNEGASKADQLLHGNIPGVDPDWEPYPYDPEGAKAALAASSYGSAENLPKLMMVGIRPGAQTVAAQYMAESWRKVLGIEAVEMHTQFDDFSGPDQEHIQIKRDDVSTFVLDPVGYLMGAIHSESGNALRKMDGYNNPEIDRLLEEASTKSPDDPDRIRLAQEAQRLFREDWMYIPWMYDKNAKGMQDHVKNYIKNFDAQIIEPWNVYIER